VDPVSPASPYAVLIGSVQPNSPAPYGPPSDLAELIELAHAGLDAFMKGDSAHMRKLFSRGDDVTLANPFGPPVRGRTEVVETMERAASHYRDGAAFGFDRVSEYETDDLAYIVEVERYRSKIGGTNDVTSFALRVTTIFRREDDGWKIIHRHADPITSTRQAESILEH